MKRLSVLVVLLVNNVHAADLKYITVPDGYDIMSGNGESSYPFSILRATNTARYQQVYAASEFSAIPNGGLITEMDFRVDEHYGGFVTTLPDIQINMSTTTKSPTSLSPVFSANIASDETIVFRRGQLSIASEGVLHLLDIRVVFDVPFYYNPAAGNLLMDVRNYEGSPFSEPLAMAPEPFDAVLFSANPRLAAVYADSVNADAGTENTFGLVTQFVVTPVPEPTSLAVLFLGGAALAAHFRFRTARR